MSYDKHSVQLRLRYDSPGKGCGHTQQKVSRLHGVLSKAHLEGLAGESHWLLKAAEENVEDSWSVSWPFLFRKGTPVYLSALFSCLPSAEEMQL